MTRSQIAFALGACGGLARILMAFCGEHGVEGTGELVVRRDADHELADRCCRGRPPRTPAAAVVPFARDQPPLPGEKRCGGHHEPLTLGGGPAATAPRATTGRPAGSGPGRSGAGGPPSPAGGPGAPPPST